MGATRLDGWATILSLVGWPRARWALERLARRVPDRLPCFGGHTPHMGKKKYYETDEFLALRDQYYAKLEEEGFGDIEILDAITRQPGSMLRGVSPGDLRRSDNRIRYVREAEEYYRLARGYLWTLERGEIRHIWKLHSEGLSTRDIATRLGPVYGTSLSRVRYTVKVHKKRMLEWAARESTITSDEE